MSDEKSKASAMSALKMACAKKSYQSFKDIVPGEYIVEKFSIVESSHGKRIRVDIDDKYMFLPERFANMLSVDDINELNESPKIMVYGGKESGNRDRLILDFRDADSFFGEDVFSYSQLV